MKSFSAVYDLDAEGIRNACERIRSYAEKARMPRRDVLELSLSYEEVLLRYQASFGSDRKFRLTLSKLFGKLHTKLFIEGEAFNPIVRADEMYFDEFAAMSPQLESLVLSLVHTYKNGINAVSCDRPITARRNDFIVMIIAAVIGGLILGFCGRLFPAPVLSFADTVLSGISDTVMGLIRMAAIPVIFLCTVNGVNNCGGISTFGKKGKTCLSRYFLVSLLMGALGIVTSLIAFSPLSSGTASGSLDGISSIIQMVFGIFPDNMLTPFANGDNVKIIFIAVLFGCAIIASGEKGHELTKGITALGDIATTIMNWICKLTPLIIFTMITKNLWNAGSLREYLTLWKLVLAILITYLISNTINICLAAKRFGMSVGDILRILLPLAVKGFISSSTLLTYPDIQEALENKFGLDRRNVSFSLPLGLISFQPSSAALCAISIYCAHLGGVAVTPAWLLLLLLLSFVTCMSAPPVSGGPVAVLAMMFVPLGIPDSYLAAATAILLLLDYLNSADRVSMLTTLTANITARTDDKE